MVSQKYAVFTGPPCTLQDVYFTYRVLSYTYSMMFLSSFVI